MRVELFSHRATASASTESCTGIRLFRDAGALEGSPRPRPWIGACPKGCARQLDSGCELWAPRSALVWLQRRVVRALASSLQRAPPAVQPIEANSLRTQLLVESAKRGDGVSGERKIEARFRSSASLRMNRFKIARAGRLVKRLVSRAQPCFARRSARLGALCDDRVDPRPSGRPDDRQRRRRIR
jgi:hypothetical protein